MVQSLDFSDPAAAGIINDWVYNNTNGKIDKIVDDIPFYIVMYLINAMYFKGTWKYEFDKNETINDWFNTPNGNQVPCKLMVQKNDFSYFENPDFQAIDLLYGDGNFSMTVLLPAPDKNVDSLIAGFSETNWAIWMNSFSEQSGTLLLPKFKLEYEITLNDVLKSMGMKIAFIPGQADFTKMYTGPFDLFIDEVKHKTFVKVDEEGTEATAATAVVTKARSAPLPPPTFRADHPFVFLIRDNDTGSILFIGRVACPDTIDT